MLIAVTNRHLCRGDFLAHIESIARGRPDAIILREKDLPEGEYQKLARSCVGMCKNYDVQLIVHSFIKVAFDLRAPRLHLSMRDFMAYCDLDGEHDSQSQSICIGVSIHSVEEAVLAERCGAAYVVAGHIFATDSKKGIVPKGLGFLGDVCGAVAIPVWAIGGITPENASCVMEKGAGGICVMSALMEAEQPEGVVAAYIDAMELLNTQEKGKQIYRCIQCQPHP
ncbi:MAG: thiamine phosphate synthase [Peptococcaceae bacterium]|nr:thiamine phosphate synthase [Peptococcaceae bacterium]